MKSINDIEKIFSQNLESPVFSVLANYYYNKRLYEHAYKVCEIGLQHDMDNIDTQYMLAKILLIKNEVKQSEQILQANLNKQPYHLNSLLLLIEIKESLNYNKSQIYKFVKKAEEIYKEHPIIKKYTVSKTKLSKSKKIKKTITKSEDNFSINSKLATKTLYQLLMKQKKYHNAYNVLLIMKKINKNKSFVSKELKNIKNYLN